MANDGVGLPVRLHDLLLAMAGRVDDDALSQARELVAVGELDRAAELLVGVLHAGRIAVTPDEQHQLAWLLDEVRSDPGLADRLSLADPLPTPRHRFTAESDPTHGVSEVLGRAVSLLPDVRGVRCVWRSSPAGSTPGPLPQRVVLVDVGPQGFAAATAHRIDSVLRRIGVRASVEVLRVGTPLSEYHAAAVTAAREVRFGEPHRMAPSRHVEAPVEDAAAWFDKSEEPRDAAPVVEPTPVPEVVDHGSVSHEPPTRRTRVAEVFESVQPYPPKPVKRLSSRESAHEEAELQQPVAEPEAEVAVAEPAADHHAADHHAADHHAVEYPVVEHVEADRSGVPPENRNEETTELRPEELAALQAALADPNGGPPSLPLPSAVDANLSDRERSLLQQLHEELAQREQVEPPKAEDTGRWSAVRSWPPNAELVNGTPHPKFPTS
ncbi:hypothetical protein [Umezawaea beigongshangensis]|uniref:hypothetical protein n=1 Tax=Umezawaea beigongshangensis TaxID=2780383 RepID=UPI0018F119F2|nr:hypothetical protein [Umezawaea beigongshangensis]